MANVTPSRAISPKFDHVAIPSRTGHVKWFSAFVNYVGVLSLKQPLPIIPLSREKGHDNEAISDSRFPIAGEWMVHCKTFAQSHV